MLSSSLKSVETKKKNQNLSKLINKDDLQVSLSVREQSDLPFTKTSSLLQSKFDAKLCSSNLHTS